MPLSPQQRKAFRLSESSPRDRALSFLHRRRHEHQAVSDAAASAGLAYYASHIPGKESWTERAEGYRIYLNVPIARTGSQEYLGRELKKNPGYKPEWNLDDNEMVTVLRPLEEVTDPVAVASFEGTSVLDEHHPDKVLIDALDEFDGISKGHAQNIRVGEVLDSGETSIIADLHIKHPELNLKIEGYDAAPVRDISCGYRFVLDRDTAGQYIQRKIRGNHVAVVPKGRAGSEVGIGDAALDKSLTRSNKMPKPNLSFLTSAKTTARDFFTGLGFKAWAATADDEAVGDAIAQLKAEGAGAADASEKENGKKTEEEEVDGAGKDKKGAKDGKGAKDDDEHPKGCRCTECMGAKDDDVPNVDEDDNKGSSMGDKKKGAKDDAEILADEDRSESDWENVHMSVKDEAAALRAIRPAIVASKDPAVRKAYKERVERFRKVQAGVADGKPIFDPFVALAKPRGQDEGVADADIDIPMWAFFNGKPYQLGLEAWNEYQTSRQTRK